MRDLKYLLAYLLPLSALFAIYAQGISSYSTLILAFVILPFFEFFFQGNTHNLSEQDEEIKLKNPYFDALLYLNIPLLWGIIFYFFHTIANAHLQTYELVGLIVSVGILCGSMGINVAHELGHRNNRIDPFLAKTLLLSSHYLHFTLEHNLGHHKYVSTDEDPASARFNESIYAFFPRSVIGSYRHAWQLETERLARLNLGKWHWKNAMLQFIVVELCYFILIYTIFNINALFAAICIGILGFLLLETINYIEHYGLRRKLLASGRYEPVEPCHSWNSNHDLGRIFLYELTRHSDHHYKASRKYQVLRHFDDSPQLPYGYPASMLLALLPSLWFKLINPKVLAWNTARNNSLNASFS